MRSGHALVSCPRSTHVRYGCYLIADAACDASAKQKRAWLIMPCLPNRVGCRSTQETDPRITTESIGHKNRPYCPRQRGQYGRQLRNPHLLATFCNDLSIGSLDVQVPVHPLALLSLITAW